MLKELQSYKCYNAEDVIVVTVVTFVTFLTVSHESAGSRVGNSAQSHIAVNSFFVSALHCGVARSGERRVRGATNECPSRIQFGCVWVRFRRVFPWLVPVRRAEHADFASSRCDALDRGSHDFVDRSGG